MEPSELEFNTTDVDGYYNKYNYFKVVEPCDKYTYNGIMEYGSKEFSLDKDLAKEEAKEQLYVYLAVIFIAMIIGLFIGANIFKIFFITFPFAAIYAAFKYQISLNCNKKVYAANKA